MWLVKSFLAFRSSWAHSENGEGLDVAGVRDVRAPAQIDQRSTPVDSALGAVGNALVDEVLLVFAVLEHLEELLFGHLETLEGLLLLDNGG